MSGRTDLVASLRRRDAVALRTVVDENARRLYRAARGMGFSNDRAEDLMQDVFVTFLHTLDRFEGRSAISTWLFGILHHKVQEQRRVAVRDEMSDPIDESFEARFDAAGNWIHPPVAPDRLAASAQMTEALRGCLDDLPSLQREVFHLRQIEELPAADVSHVLGRSVTHVGVLFHRARLRLQQCLEKKGWSPAP
ncbi:MAG: sigma-70 family RNA polymerase sigma factor [Vicinamibacterales bacterium]